jgi:hypothetical protein
MKSKFNTFVLYIEDDEDTGGIKISAEAFGKPMMATEIGASIFGSLAEQENVTVLRESVYTSYPPTEYAQ